MVLEEDIQFIDQLFALGLVMENVYEFGIDFHSLFINFKQASDTVDKPWPGNE